ncbi:MAG: YdcF family protein [Alphaproteobacteria bacterium]
MTRRNVVVVFGAAVGADGRPSPTLARRIAGAVAFGQGLTDRLADGLSDPTYIVTGGRGRSGFVEADTMRAAMVAAGVKPDAIVCEPVSTDTLGSVVRCARLIAAWPETTVVHVCTSRYHQVRCRILLRLAGLPSLAAPMPPDRPAMGWTALGWMALGLAVLREALAIPYDMAVLAWRGNDPTVWP